MIEKIKKLASDLENKTINYRKDLHRFPEPRWREFRTASIAIKKMQELGYTITMGSDALSKEYMMSVPDETTLKNAQINAINHGADKELVDRIACDDMVRGVTVACGGFFGPQGRQLRIPLADPQQNKKIENFEYNGLKITNFEMESSALAGLARLMGHKATTCCMVIANRITQKSDTGYKKHIDDLIKIVLERI